MIAGTELPQRWLESLLGREKPPESVERITTVVRQLPTRLRVSRLIVSAEGTTTITLHVGTETFRYYVGVGTTVIPFRHVIQAGIDVWLELA